MNKYQIGDKVRIAGTGMFGGFQGTVKQFILQENRYIYNIGPLGWWPQGSLEVVNEDI